MTDFENQFANECIFATPDPKKRYNQLSWLSSYGWTKLMKWVLLTKKNPFLEQKIRDYITKYPEEINARNIHGYTALMIAVLNINTRSTPETVNTLLNAGANVDMQTLRGDTILTMLFQKNYTRSMTESNKYLTNIYDGRNKKTQIDRYSTSLILDSYILFDKSIGKENIQKVFPIPEVLNYEWEMFGPGDKWLTKNGRITVANFSKDFNIWINTKSLVLKSDPKYSVTDKIYANIIVTKENNVFAKVYDSTCITHADTIIPLDDMIDSRVRKMYYQYDPIEELTHRTTEVNIHNSNGQTALHLAIKQNNPHYIKLLLDSGADPNMKPFDNSSNQKHSPLEQVVGRSLSKSDIDCIKQLLGVDMTREIPNFNQYLVDQLKEKLDN